MDFVIVAHTGEPGSSRVYGPFGTQDEAVGAVPRLMAVAKDVTVAEVCQVLPWSALDSDPDMRVDEPAAVTH